MPQHNLTSLKSFLIRIFNSIGFFMIIPLLSLWLVEVKEMDLAKASIIVASLTLMSKAGSAFVGGIISRLGIKISLLIGLFGASLILFLITFSSNYLEILILVVLLGIFISLYNIALKTQIAIQEEAKRLNGYALLNIAVNIGASIGPLFGGIVLDWSPGILLLVSMINYLLAGVIALVLPSVSLQTSTEDNFNVLEFARSRKNNNNFNTFLQFLLFTSVFWFFYTQLFTTFPIVFSENFNGKVIGLFFTLNAVIVIVTQGFFPSIKKHCSQEIWYAIALLLITTSFFLLWISPTIVVTVISILLFSLSEVIWVPTIDSELVVLRGGLNSAWAFGVGGIIWGLGEALGSLVGLNIYNNFKSLTFLILSLMSFIFLLGYVTKYEMRKKMTKKTSLLLERK